MGNSSIHPAETRFQNVKQAYQDRVLNSIMATPINLACILPLELKNPSLSSESSFRKQTDTLRHRVATTSMSYIDNETDSLSNEWPFSAHGRLSIKFAGKTCVGSGTCIGPRFVLTAAANIFSHDCMQEVNTDKIEFQPGSMLNSSVSKLRVIEIYYSKKFLNTGKEDFALLILNKDIVDLAGCFGLNSKVGMDLVRPLTYLCGYERKLERFENERLCTKGPSDINIEDDLIQHDLDTSAYLNGAILYHQEDSKYYIIGIHSSHKHQAKSSSILYLNTSRVKKIESWIRKYYMKYSIITSLDLSLFSYSISNILLQFSKGVNSNLVSLDLRGNCIGPKGARTLAKRKFQSLRSLNLDRTELGSEGARNLAKGKLSGLTHLSLGENKIGPEGARDLSHGNLRNLQVLDFFYNNIGNEGAILLAYGQLSTLISLNLRDNNLGPLAAKGLATGNLQNLTNLNLADNQIGNNGAFELSQGNFINMHTLDVSCNGIRSEGAAALSHGKLVKLTVLNMDHNNLGGKTIARLARGNTRCLTRVCMEGNRFEE